MHLYATVALALTDPNAIDFEALSAEDPDLDYDVLIGTPDEAERRLELYKGPLSVTDQPIYNEVVRGLVLQYLDTYAGGSEFVVTAKKYKPHIKGIEAYDVHHVDSSIEFKFQHACRQDSQVESF